MPKKSSFVYSNRQRSLIDSLYRISRVVSLDSNHKEILNIIIDEIMEVFEPYTASIALIDPKTKDLEIVVSRGLERDSKKLRLKIGQGITGWVALHGQPLLVPNVTRDKRYVKVHEGVVSEIAVPMEDRGNVIGVVNIDTDQVAGFHDEDLKSLSLLTQEASRVVNHIWLFSQLRTQKNQLQTIIKAGQKLVQNLQSPELLDQITEKVLQFTNCKICALFLKDPDSEKFSLQSISGVQAHDINEKSFQLGDTSFDVAISRKKQVEVMDLPKTEEYHFVPVIQKFKLASLLATPLIFEDQVIGMLNVYTENYHRFSNPEKQTVYAIANFASIAIQNANLYQRLFKTEEQLRKNDKLTTLGFLSAEIAHEIRNPLTVVKLLFDNVTLSLPSPSASFDDAEIIREKFLQLEEIVERVLNFGKSNERLFMPCNLNELLLETIQLVRLKLHQKRIVLQYENNYSITLNANKGQLQQVILNLIINSMEALPHGGVITIKVDEKPESIHILFKDNGTGIPLEIQPKIFDSFLSGRHTGTGLGMTVIKQILKNHQGDITLVRSDSLGTLFLIILPLRS